MKIEEIRKELDKIDNKLLDLLSIRLAYCKNIAQYKISNNMKIIQPEREKQILAEKKLIAKNKNLSQEFVEKLFNNIFKESKRIQKEEIEKTK